VKKKFLLLFPFVFFALSGFAFADWNFYPGVYLGADWNRPIDNGKITIGADLQAGFELFYWDGFIFAFLGNMGVDTGQPNEPNFYYGGMAEFYFSGYDTRAGLALGWGWNKGLKDNGRRRDSFYIRLGMPVNFEGRTKYGFYFDFYPGVGSRLGYIMHF
jgi:hypothetical protein